MSEVIEFARASVRQAWEHLSQHDLALTSETAHSVWAAIECSYSEPARAYHTLEHIHDLITISLHYKPKVKDYSAVFLAIIFHDIVYDVTSDKNEEKSAELFSTLLKEYLNVKILEKTFNYIIATKNHHPGECLDNDLLLFLDFDMSILGRDREEYSSYAAKIRKEFSHVEEQAFNVGRSTFLKKILQSNGNIFLTEEFQSVMERKARSNLEWEINLLESKIQQNRNIS